MRAKSMVLILIALGCGLVASIAISQVIERGGAGGVETVQIYVATADIDVNEQLSANNVRVEDWPKSKVPEGAVLDFDSINECFARVRFYEGEPIMQAKLANEIEGPAIKIPEGFRVCSFKVQMDTAISGLVNPGDRVDIFGYFRKGQDVPRTGTRELLRNVRVFAVNSETEQETDQEGKTIVAKTVSVLVEQDQVAKLMLATELGTLRLALRRPNESSESSEGDEASVESLFSSRSESSDEDNPDAPAGQGSSQLASAANKFGQFLANLQQDNTPGPQTLTSVAAGPSWEMEVLTPDGGTNFTWDDVNRLPLQGDAAGSGMVNPLRTSTPPVNGLRGLTGGPINEPPAPQGQPEEEEEEEEEEEDNQEMGDD